MPMTLISIRNVLDRVTGTLILSQALLVLIRANHTGLRSARSYPADWFASTGKVERPVGHCAALSSLFNGGWKCMDMDNSGVVGNLFPLPTS